MKALEELGISPMPWKLTPWMLTPPGASTEASHGEIVDAIGQPIFSDYCFPIIEDARLIAAAPELYEELRQEMERRYCVECKHAVWTKRGGIEIMTGCDGKGSCPKPSWKNALDKASGEVTNG